MTQRQAALILTVGTVAIVALMVVFFMDAPSLLVAPLAGLLFGGLTVWVLRSPRG